MNLQIHKHEKVNVAELITENIKIQNVQDALDLIGNADYLGARKVIVHEKQLSPDFFILSTRLPGEILQKFSTYRVALAIVGDFSKYNSKSLKAFMYESNKGRQVLFLNSVEKALGILQDK